MESKIVDRDLLTFHVVMLPKVKSSYKNKPVVWHAKIFWRIGIRFFEGEGGVRNSTTSFDIFMLRSIEVWQAILWSWWWDRIYIMNWFMQIESRQGRI